MPAVVFETQLQSLPLIHRGKVRDIYDAGPEHLLIVTSDRLSAFDVVLPDPIPGKGAVLTGISTFWFERTRHIIPNHLAHLDLSDLIKKREELALLQDRAMLVRKLGALPIEAVVRGYLIGSGWKDYQKTGAVCGIELPPGLKLADQLPQPLFTPATKAPKGQHDENISYAQAEKLLGRKLAEQVSAKAVELYNYAAAHARQRGIIIADTKFEFGVDEDHRLTLIDEALTPDSSRFWPVDSYRPGISPPSFDKQYVRDYLETLDWNKKAPGPHLPAEVIAKTAEKYQEAWRRLTS
ncbi:MAG: phosphoribosylaminoimidazolesuccinocarboxamide synthase [Gammaproteobacteria bacterium]|nr:phosphoribosylaminoimidazolesuccinocarboxamide synthase [Gammaproteobacteria bacterium]MDE2023113.1 phosphoribosylaminoimidazolesuccinocarboxamide synthase [Gammaproteobacteria bacterium]